MLTVSPPIPQLAVMVCVRDQKHRRALTPFLAAFSKKGIPNIILTPKNRK
jgi:hypothetical protein